MLLRDGTETNDPRLDRLRQQDPRSLEFPITAVVPEGVKQRTWALNERLDQGREGACVGFGVSHRIAAAPIEAKGITDVTAQAIYKAAQKIDPWPGEQYEGTSVLAGVQVAQQLGHFTEYRWCFGVDDMMRALSHEGPIVVGTVWKDSMFAPAANGVLDCSGTNQGGHCYLIRGLDLRKKGGPYFRITNSWGPDWGKKGDAWIRVEDYEAHLLPEGDACVPVEARRRRPSPRAERRTLGHWWTTPNRPWRR